MKLVFIPLLFLWFAQPFFAQIVTVFDIEINEPLEFVTISSASPKKITTTDIYGQANLSSFKDSEKISFQMLGYKKRIISYSELKSLQNKIYLTPSNISLDQVVVSATKWNQSIKKVPSKVSSITPKDVEMQNPQTAADLLNISGDVFIQKSQQGGGSPMIRGFATNRVLISVDGIRMNNAIFRSGNIQNVISLDPFTIENAEVVFGPGSIIYGSDAIGGSMNFYTIHPQFSISSSPKINGHAQYRFSSANNENTGHFDITLGLNNFASLTSFTYNSFGNIHMGSDGPDEYTRNEYVKTISGKDFIYANTDNKSQTPTEYSQLNIMQKFRFSPNEKWYLDYGFHYSETSDYDRYDRLTLYTNNLPKSAEWYYGPQKWMMNNLTITNLNSNNFYDDLAIRMGYQYFEESRNDRGFRQSNLRVRLEEVYAYSLNVDFNKSLSELGQIIYGVEGVFNKVISSGTNKNILTGTSIPSSSRYPQSDWYSLAAYFVYQYQFENHYFLQTGLRYNYFGLSSEFDTTYFPFPFTQSEQKSQAITGSVGLTYHPNDNWAINLNLSTGFRAPNVDDIGKVFDSEPGAVVVPNPNLNAEYAYNAEVGIAKLFSNNIKVDITGYYTILKDAMVRKDFTLNGKDSIYYDGTLSQVQAIQNSANAYVWGIQTGLEMNILKNLSFSTKLNYQRGEEELENGNNSPLRHAAPLFSNSHLSFRMQNIRIDASFIYNGEISNSNLAEEEQGKTNIYAIDKSGKPYSPSWYNVNLKLQYLLTSNLSTTFGIENITDQRYRPYSSGISGPGRNFVLSLKLKY